MLLADAPTASSPEGRTRRQSLLRKGPGTLRHLLAGDGRRPMSIKSGHRAQGLLTGLVRRVGGVASKLASAGSMKSLKVEERAPSTTTAGSGSERIAGLRAALAGAKLVEREADAIAWFESQGLDSIADLCEAEMENDLVVALKLKPGKAKILLKHVSAAADAATAAGSRKTDHATPPSIAKQGKILSDHV